MSFRLWSSEMRPHAKPAPSLEVLCERFLELERSIEEERSLGRPNRAQTLTDLADQRRRVLGWAASRLPSRGPSAEWFHAALEGAWGEPTQLFAVNVAWHARQFPRRYVEPVVRWALRANEPRLITQASTWHGAIPVLEAMTVAVERGELGYSRRDFFEYSVRSRKDEEAEEIDAARRRLQDASFRAPDAPPGARRAGEDP
jgi:hypothetical protein